MRCGWKRGWKLSGEKEKRGEDEDGLLLCGRLANRPRRGPAIGGARSGKAPAPGHGLAVSPPSRDRSMQERTGGVRVSLPPHVPDHVFYTADLLKQPHLSSRHLESSLQREGCCVRPHGVCLPTTCWLTRGRWPRIQPSKKSTKPLYTESVLFILQYTAH